MDVAPAAETFPDLDPMTMLKGCFRQVWKLYATSIDGAAAQPVDQRAVYDGCSDLRLGGGEVQKEIIDGAFGG